MIALEILFLHTMFTVPRPVSDWPLSHATRWPLPDIATQMGTEFTEFWQKLQYSARPNQFEIISQIKPFSFRLHVFLWFVSSKLENGYFTLIFAAHSTSRQQLKMIHVIIKWDTRQRLFFPFDLFECIVLSTTWLVAFNTGG